MFTTCCVALALLPKPLTIGGPAPKLEPTATLRGNPLTALPQGKIVVVEFSGTQCAPCTKCIPLLNAMQAKHKSVEFVSVFNEDEKRVREYLAGHGKEIHARVVTADRKLWNDWMDAAGMIGIPTVFIVSAEGDISWIGSPFDLDEVLDQVVAGKFDPRLQSIRLQFERIQNEQNASSSRRIMAGNEARSRVGKLFSEKRWSEAAATAERSIREFPECKFEHEVYLVHALAAQPETTPRALELAATLSAKYRRSWKDGNPRSGAFEAELAASLIAGYKTNPDPALLVAAEILIDRSRGFLEDTLSRYREQLHLDMRLTIARTAVDLV